MSSCRRLCLGITGATGMLYIPALLELVHAQGVEIHGVASETGSKVLHHELGVMPEDLPQVSHWFEPQNFFAAPASGSSSYDAMVILPCSMGTLAAIANGYNANLLHRCAEVTLKERRPLILCVRETPLNHTHLKNMLTAHEAGACICPPMPAFYNHPKELKDIAFYFAARICDLLGIPLSNTAIPRWQGKESC